MLNSDKCFICNGSDRFLNHKFSLKKGWFKKEVYNFCSQCRLHLDLTYGSFKWYEDDDSSGAFCYLFKGKIINDLEDIEKFKSDRQQEISNLKARETRKRRAETREGRASLKKIQKDKQNKINKLKRSIVKLLKEKTVKMPASDIDAHLKHKNVDEIKRLCEKLYQSGKINRTGNYRYFILTEEKKKPKKVAVKKTGSVADEIKKFKELLDAGAITQEEYDAKKKELLGL